MAVNYKCTSIGCYSYQSPETNALFQTLQTRINQLAGPAGIAPVKVDGIIGKGTTEAALLVLDYIATTATDTTVISVAGGLEASISTVENLATGAQSVVDVITLALKQTAIAQQAPAAPLPVPTPAPSPTQIATTTANKPTTATTAVAQNKINAVQMSRPALATNILDRMPPWLAYASGGLLAAGALVAVVAAKRRKSAPAVAGRWW